MNIVNITLTFESNKKIECKMQFEHDYFFVCDDLINDICVKNQIYEKLKICTVTLGVNNISLVIQNYTLTKTIYFNNFYNIHSHISILKAPETNIHIVGQYIEHMQVDCKKILICDCNIKKLDLGLSAHYNNIRNKEENLLYITEELELRDSIVENVKIYAQCNYINIQGCRIHEFNNYGSVYKKIHSKINLFTIYQNTEINKLLLSNQIDKFTCDNSLINVIIANSNVVIDDFNEKNTTLINCYGFQSSNFKKHTYSSWKLIEISSKNSRNSRERIEANYQMAKISFLDEYDGNKLLSYIFDCCAGFGYKPFKIINASFIVILFNSLIFSFIKFISILCIGPIAINTSLIPNCIYGLLNSFLLSIASFAGQSNLSINDGIIFWFSTVEYIIGVIFFAIFVNALYVRYKE